MKIIAISDTHMEYDLNKIPEGDILIIAGDILRNGSLSELRIVMKDLNTVSHKWEHILIVPGNHDRILEKWINSKISWENFMEEKKIYEYPQNMTISHEGVVDILGIKIFTWAWIPNLPNWAFHLKDEDIAEHIKLIKLPGKEEKVDMVVSHGPPHDRLDVIKYYNSVGSTKLEEALTFKYDIHIFGHVHEGKGEEVEYDENGEIYRTYYNVSVLDKVYKEYTDDLRSVPCIINLN